MFVQMSERREKLLASGPACKVKRLTEAVSPSCLCRGAVEGQVKVGLSEGRYLSCCKEA